MNTKPNSVANAAAALAGKPEVEARVEKAIKRNQIVSRLLKIRVSKGLTQEYVADKMNCDASKISRMEAGSDFNLRWNDIVGYLNAVNVKVCLSFEDSSLPAEERIKLNVHRIHAGLEELVALARQTDGDDVMANKIHQFYGEVLLNFALRYKESYTNFIAASGVTPSLFDPSLDECDQQSGEIENPAR